MTPEQVKALSTAELIAKYNALTNKSIKKFSSRAAGERQVLAALARRTETTPASTPAVTTVTRAIKGAASGRNGRPKASYIVVLTEEKAKSKPHEKSDRAALIAHLKTCEPFQYNNERLTHAAWIEVIEKHFAKRMRGVVQKLIEKGWLRRIDVA